MQFLGNPTAATMLILTVIQTIVILGAAVVVTRRSRRSRIPGLDWIALGFWLFVADVVLGILSFAINALLVAPSAGPQSLGAITYLDDAFALAERVLETFGFLALAYGATRLRGRQLGRRSERSIRPELEELGVPRAAQRVRRMGRWLTDADGGTSGDE